MAEQMIDWSFFSMAGHLLAADPDDGTVMTAGAWDRFLGGCTDAEQEESWERH